MAPFRFDAGPAFSSCHGIVNPGHFVHVDEHVEVVAARMWRVLGLGLKSWTNYPYAVIECARVECMDLGAVVVVFVGTTAAGVV